MMAVIQNILDIISGKKTYAVCVAGMLVAVAIKFGYVVSMQDAMALATGLISLAGIFMRTAITKAQPVAQATTPK